MDLSKILADMAVPYTWLVMALMLLAFVVIKTSDSGSKK